MRKFFLIGILLLLAPAAQADEEKRKGEESAAQIAITLPGRTGLAGMFDMIDARTPQKFLSIRGGTHYNVFARDLDFDGAINATRKRRLHALSLYAGVSFLKLADAAIRVPYIWDHTELNVHGNSSLDREDEDRGWGNVELAGKVTLTLGPIDVAPYLRGTFPTGEPEVQYKAELEYGAAATFSFLNHYGAIHANLAGFQQEEGLSALRLRIGASFVVWADRMFVIRVFGYGDAIEFEGSSNADVDIDVGVQGILFQMITLEVSFSARVVDGNHLEDIEEELGINAGILEKHFDDDGTYVFRFGVGVIF